MSDRWTVLRCLCGLPLWYYDTATDTVSLPRMRSIRRHRNRRHVILPYPGARRLWCSRCRRWVEFDSDVMHQHDTVGVYVEGPPDPDDPDFF